MKTVKGYIYNGQLWTPKGELTSWEMRSSGWVDSPRSQAFLKKHGLTTYNVAVFSMDGRWLVGKVRNTAPADGQLFSKPGDLLFEGRIFSDPPPGFGARRVDDERWTYHRVGKRVLR